MGQIRLLNYCRNLILTFSRSVLPADTADELIVVQRRVAYLAGGERCWMLPHLRTGYGKLRNVVLIQVNCTFHSDMFGAIRIKISLTELAKVALNLESLEGARFRTSA